MTEPIFERAGDRVVPTALARGPWDEGACHGGAPAALLAALIDTVPSPAPMQAVRVTYEILRPVPLARLAHSLRILRDGKRIQVVEAILSAADGTELMACRALRIRSADLALPPDATSDEPAPEPGPAELSRLVGGAPWEIEGFWRAVDVRFAAGAIDRPGAATAWFRVAAALCDGVEVTPLARAAAAADFGNGISSPLPFGSYLFVNPDLTVDLHRLPAGEWVALAARTVTNGAGVGLTTSQLYDRDGRIGVALQSLYVDERSPAC